MHANVVVKRMPYVIVPSPAKRTNLFGSVTSCKKLQAGQKYIHNVCKKAPVQIALWQGSTYFYR